MVNQVLLMAAGLGTRLRPFTAQKTKILMPVLGIPVVQFAVDALRAAGVKTLVANVHHDPQNTIKGLQAIDHKSSSLFISDESQELLGTAGGIRKAISLMNQAPFFLSNADAICDLDWLKLEAQHQKLREQYGVILTLAVFSSAPKGGFYREIFMDSQNELITHLGNLSEGKPFYVGAAILEPEALSEVPASGPAEFVPTILMPAIQKGKAGAFFTQGIWLDIGSPLLWQQTHFEVLSLIEKDQLNHPITQKWKERVFQLNEQIDQGVWISRNAKKVFKSDFCQEPCYWNLSEDDFSSLPLPLSFKMGPDCVLYDSVPHQTDYKSGIGFGGKWVNLCP